jgi:hypothetical protein
MKKTLIITISIIVVVLASGAFYWFSWRPSQIRSTCQSQVDQEYVKVFNQYFQTQADGTRVRKSNWMIEMKFDDDKKLKDAAQATFEPCLRRHGI